MGCPCVIWFVFVENELYCVGYYMFFQPWDRQPSLLHIQLFHTGSSILTRYLYPKTNPVVSQFMWFTIDPTVIASSLGSMQENQVVPMCIFIFSVTSTWNILGAILKVFTQLTLLVIDLVLCICVLFIYTLMYIFGVFSTSGITLVCDSGLSAFIS